MKYLCLAYADQKKWDSLPKSSQDALLAQDAILRGQGHLVAAVAEATTVRFVNGTATTSAGPLARS